MWEALTKLYQSDCQYKMGLKEKLKNTVATYITKIRQVWDELVVIGEAVPNLEMVKTTLQALGNLCQWDHSTWAHTWIGEVMGWINKRRFERSLFMGAALRVMMRTFPLPIRQGRAGVRPRRTQEDGVPQELEKRRTWAKWHTLHVTSLATMQANVRTRRRAKGIHRSLHQRTHNWASLLTCLRNNPHWWHVFLAPLAKVQGSWTLNISSYDRIARVICHPERGWPRSYYGTWK